MIGTCRILKDGKADTLMPAYDLEEAQCRADRILRDQPDIQRVEVIRRWRDGRVWRRDTLEVRARSADDPEVIVTVGGSLPVYG